ncbi:hypothetical protein L486_00073 [Kwoniella mangroviensis CBS 10435]|uniref:Transcriptional coactivator p15 (PC4) C-terminal domain-containing protein n=1 Tax=Kwoniella mangroviensis CBS 10435 TaxID=1331196 RepID=A0A1B9IY45_9TREE|nr:uncharacterized protein I203_00757 [Kwoniella mangroviensis CBS 8507]OCF60440.1 hypothetical protein L486_00073 [Kwoniella mangroviensis CBS 10435]OCF70622.1 hypothetical protein I203_00757 [Kwoniella mangroviensis CBS 8507]OCF74811.1 hypothetical protein I204_05193 [Kwoniella mangroviensis CBS 8886]
MPPRNTRNLSSSGDEVSEGKPDASTKASSSKRAKDQDDNEGIEPKSKKSKSSDNKETSGGEVEIEENEDGDSFFKLSEYRRLTVRTFKGKVLIDIRETYKDKSTGQIKPGSKGISLTKEQWDVLRSNIENVDDMIVKVNEK